jgi:hypothetical protein
LKGVIKVGRAAMCFDSLERIKMAQWRIQSHYFVDIITNCLLRQVIEGKIKGGIEVTGKRGRRSRKLLDDIKERRDTHM